MRRFFNEMSGNAVIGAAFMILIFCTIAFVIYSGISIYTNYQTAENELQRAMTVTVNECMVNQNVRDLELDIPAQKAIALLEDTLAQSGWAIGNREWIKQDGERNIYRLDEAEVNIDGQTMQVNAMFVMPIPWAMGGITQVSIPLTTQESVLYIKQ